MRCSYVRYIVYLRAGEIDIYIQCPLEDWWNEGRRR